MLNVSDVTKLLIFLDKINTQFNLKKLCEQIPNILVLVFLKELFSAIGTFVQKYTINIFRRAIPQVLSQIHYCLRNRKIRTFINFL